MKSKTISKINCIVAAFVLICCTTSVFALWNYAEGAAFSASKNLQIELKPFSYINGVYILDAQPITTTNATKINNFTNDEQNLTATMNVTVDVNNQVESVVYKVKFHNNTDKNLVFSTVSASGLTVSVDGFDNSLRTIRAHSVMTCNVTMASDATNKNVVFSFAKVGQTSAPTPTITEGTSSDNINTMGDGSSNYSTSTNNRWTNWTSSSSGLGAPVSMFLVWGEQKTFDQIKIYHFVDASKNPGPCDFPESITVEYYDADTDSYKMLFSSVLLTTNSGNPNKYTTTASGVQISQNWSDASRRNGDNVYVMKIDDKEATFIWSYTGDVPCTTFSFDGISTQALRITFDAKSGCFVGITEIEYFNDGTKI